MIEMKYGQEMLDYEYERGKKREKTLDIMKGIGIILVVVGHSGAPFEHFISLFHMAVFFMASGYCWNEKYVSNFSAAKHFVIKRIRSLWLPFALCNGLFSIFHNVFLRIGIYTSNENVLLADPAMYRYLSGYMELHEILCAVLKNILFAGETQLGGATWFLRTLFVVSVVHLFFCYIAVNWKYGKIVYGVFVAGIFVAAALVTHYDLRMPMGIHTCFAAYIAFLGGVLLKRTNAMEKNERKPLIDFMVSLLILLIGNSLGSVSMNVGEITNITFFAVVSLSGWNLLWVVSSHIKGIFADALVYCGQHSIWIVMMHFLAFKLVSVLYQRLTGAASYMVAVFPTIKDDFLWIVYILAGTIVPLLVGFVLEQCLKRRRENKTAR